MALVLYDTNIIIDALKGILEALEELSHWDKPAISVITWMEVYSGAKPEDIARLDAFFKDFGFEIIHTNEAIMRRAAQVRAESIRSRPKIALPDAIILATALVRNMTVITRNFKDFKGASIRLPYELVIEADGSVKTINVSPKILPSPPKAPPIGGIMTWSQSAWQPVTESQGKQQKRRLIMRRFKVKRGAPE